MRLNAAVLYVLTYNSNMEVEKGELLSLISSCFALQDPPFSQKEDFINQRLPPCVLQEQLHRGDF